MQFDLHKTNTTHVSAYLSTNRSLFYTHFEVDRTVNLLCLSNIRREDNNYILTRNLYEYEEYHEKNGTL